MLHEPNKFNDLTIVNTVLCRIHFHAFRLLVLYKWQIFCQDTISVYEIKKLIMYYLSVFPPIQMRRKSIEENVLHLSHLWRTLVCVFVFLKRLRSLIMEYLIMETLKHWKYWNHAGCAQYCSYRSVESYRYDMRIRFEN